MEEIFLQREAVLGVGKGAKRSEPREEEACLWSFVGFHCHLHCSLHLSGAVKSLSGCAMRRRQLSCLSLSVCFSLSAVLVGAHMQTCGVSHKNTRAVWAAVTCTPTDPHWCPSSSYHFVYRKPHFCGLLLWRSTISKNARSAAGLSDFINISLARVDPFPLWLYDFNI